MIDCIRQDTAEMSAKNSAAAKSDITSISIDAEKDEDLQESPKIIEVPKWIEPNSDEEDNGSFNVERSWDTLLSLPTCQHVIIRPDIQEKLHIVAGVHLTDECAWKQIPIKLLRQYLFDEITNGQELLAEFQNFDGDNPVLIGYAPHLVEDELAKQDGDSYVFVLGAEDTKLAFTIARNIQLYESWHLKQRIYRKPRRWESLGSEHEVDLTLPDRIVEPMDVEIQAVYPLCRKPLKGLTLRLSGDVRDGYTELVPSEEYDNVVRSRITLGIQSAPECRNIEQQTDPTFPTNAWAQYLYEITEDLEMDESDKEPEPEPDKNQSEQPKLPATEEAGEENAEEKPPKPPPDMSDQIKMLLKILEFNQVDIYRNDYELIAPQRIEHCSTAQLEENVAFMNLEKCGRRYVSSIDWYSNTLVVAAYAENIIATKTVYSAKTAGCASSVLQKHPVLMWSTLDNLNYKLEFETKHEVTTLNFCPYNKAILVGGLKNGQIIVWDLKMYLEKLDEEEYLNMQQIKYRHLMSKYTKDQVCVNTERTVIMANITSRGISHDATVTGIRWLGHGYAIDEFGKFEYDQRRGDGSGGATFISSALDGSIKFWSLHVHFENGYSIDRRSSLPELLLQVESPIKQQLLKPIFTLTFNEPLTGYKFDMNLFKSLSEPLEPNADSLSEQDEEATQLQSLLVATYYGHVKRLKWQPADPDSETFEVQIRKDVYAHIHDGPILSLKQHPQQPDIFVTLSCSTFAIWRESYEYTPILWRKRNYELTGISWSKERPAVLFVIRADGHLEIWDLLARDDDACLTQLLDCSGLTVISEKGPLQPDKVLSIGDESTTLRMIKLPKSYYLPRTNELEYFFEYIQRQEQRKQSIQVWEHKYYERNRDVIDAKLKAAADARKLLERLEKDLELRRRFTKHEEEVREPSSSRLRYTQRMKKRWDEENLKRVLGILTTRRRIDADRLEAETRLEKERLQYEAAKKHAMKTTSKQVSDAIAAMRTCILPKEVAEISRKDVVNDMVDAILKKTDTFADITKQCQMQINQFTTKTFDNYASLHTANARRHTMNVAMSEGTHRQFWYNDVRKNNEMQICDWGYEVFLNACIEESAKEPKQTALELNSNSAPINMQDGMSLNSLQ